jgi:hypothetical protein
VLEIIGKVASKDSEGSAAKGIILPQQMAAAVLAIEAAVVQEEAEQAAARAAALARNEALPRFEAISLRQRTLPFITMLQRCEKTGHEIVWGV